MKITHMKIAIIPLMALSTSSFANEVDDLIDEIIDAEMISTYCILTNENLVTKRALISSAVISNYLQESKDWGWGQTPDRYISRAVIVWAANDKSGTPLSTERCKKILSYGIHMMADSIDNQVIKLKRKGQI